MRRALKGWSFALALALPAAVFGLGFLRASPEKIGVDPAAQTASAPGRLFLPATEVQTAAGAGLVPADARSILKIPSRMRYGDFVWNERGVGPGQIDVRVHLRKQLISVFRGGHEIGSAVILYGADSHETPKGSYPVLAKARDYWSITYDAPMPFALRLTNDGVAIHGSDVRRGAATHGCIGVPLEFAQHLFDETQVGDLVHIVDSPDGAARVRRT